MDQLPTLDKMTEAEKPMVRQERVETNPEVASPTSEALRADLDATNISIHAQTEIISTTTDRVNEIRHSLGLEGEITDIPSVDSHKKKVEELAQRKTELEAKLKDILQSDVSHKYADAIAEVKKSKIDWAHSEELARRLKLKGATEEDVELVKNWLVTNATEAKTFILPATQFNELVDVLYEMTGSENLKDGAAFHISGGIEDVPEYVRSSVVLAESQKPPLPPIPGKPYVPLMDKQNIDKTLLHHEFGHATQDGLLGSELYKNWKPTMKDGAPDPEYVGLIQETDTRIRSMFRDLKGEFEPGKGIFGRKQLEILQEKYQKGELSKDTKDLLQHYGPIELVKLANRMPAI